MTGTIPPELGNLTNLQTLSLAVNRIAGEIPKELGNLSTISSINLSGNKLIGSIPFELSNLSNLGLLKVDANDLTGSIPGELGQLSILNLLDLSNNQLAGSIPSELGNLASLQFLFIDYNLLSGAIPAELGKLTNLEMFDLDSNNLSGPIPDEFINFTNILNGFLDLRWNGLDTNNADLDIFLNTKQRTGDWRSTQTIAPNNISITGATSDALAISATISLAWDAIDYINDDGRYRAWYSESINGPYLDGGATLSKSDTTLTINNLADSTSYYIAIRSETDAHLNNPNDIQSDNSTFVINSTDLWISIDNGQKLLQGGESVQYDIVVGNDGPIDVVGATITSTIPSELTLVEWFCSASMGAQCGQSSGSGEISSTLDIAMGSTINITIGASILTNIEGRVTVNAAVSTDTFPIDLDLSNNLGVDSDFLGVFSNGFE